MKLKYSIMAVVGAAILSLGISAVAQNQDTFKARLSALPADAKTRPDLAGLGTVTGVLAGTKLTINGTFDGLRTPATAAHLHASVAAGVRGPEFHDLTVSHATSGTVTGTVDLTPPQIEALRKGGVYVQLHSEKAPDGVLWGWLLH